MAKEYCQFCKEDVVDPCETLDAAVDDGCINPTKKKRGLILDPAIAKKVREQQEGIHGISSGPGSFTN